MNIPNVLTCFRILSIPAVIYLWDSKHYLIAVSVLGLSALTDFFDGMLARKLNQITTLGSILDPVADKLLVISCFGYHLYLGLCPWWYFAIVMLRNVSQLACIPILMGVLRIRFKVKPKAFPKYATALSLTLAFIGFLLLWMIEQGLSLPGLYYGYLFLLIVSGAMEAKILFEFIPRFLQIASGKHDTFE